MVIEQQYSNEGFVLSKLKTTNWSPTIDAVVTSVSTRISTLSTERFLVDSGASLTILGPRLANVFKDSIPVDNYPIRYGSGPIVKLDVFEVILTIKGYEFNILAAFDPKLAIKHHLLGVTKGFDQFHHVLLNNQHRITKFVKKY